MRFVNTHGGFVNLAHVAEIRTRKEKLPPGRVDPASLKNEVTVYSFFGADHQPLGETTDFEPDDLLATVVPAAPGAFVYVVTDYQGSVDIDQVSVVAWKIEPGDGEPVLTDPLASNQIVLIPQPDGKVTLPYDRTFGSLDEAREYFQAKAADKDNG